MDITDFFALADAPQGVPTFERLLDRARALTAASVNWEPGKTVGKVSTFSLKPLQGKGPRWWARVSEHGPRHGKSGFDLVRIHKFRIPCALGSIVTVNSNSTIIDPLPPFRCTLCSPKIALKTRKSVSFSFCPTPNLITFWLTDLILHRHNKDLESAQFLKNCQWGEGILCQYGRLRMLVTFTYSSFS